MHVGPIGKPTRTVPIGKQPCHLCEDEYGDPSGLVRVKNATHGRAAFIRGMIDLEKCHPSCGVGNVCRGTAVLPPKVTCAGVRDRVTELFDSNLCRWESGIVIPNCAYRLPWRGTGDTAPVMAIFRRGFVDEVRLPAAAFTEGFARELFSRHPVTKVVLTDKQPHGTGLPVTDNEYPGWMRCCDPTMRQATDPWGVPRYMFDQLADSILMTFGSANGARPSKFYATADDGRAALSAACVAWGRSLAGPPPLPHTSGGA